MSLNIGLWAGYFLFVAAMFALHWHPQLLDFSGQMGAAKLLICLIYLAFLVYSLVCSKKENIVRTVRDMSRLWWGRQIGIDLYIGIFLSTLIVYMNEGLIGVAVWIVPFIIFANLATLVYFIIQFEAIVGAFIS